MGWFRSDDDPDVAEVAAWLRLVMAWIGDTALIGPAPSAVILVPADPEVTCPEGVATPDAPVRLIVVETAA